MIDVSFFPCWLAPTRDAADGAVKLLAEAGIAARLATPGDRYTGLSPGQWEVRVSAEHASRARSLLLAEQS